MKRFRMARPDPDGAFAVALVADADAPHTAISDAVLPGRAR